MSDPQARPLSPKSAARQAALERIEQEKREAVAHTSKESAHSDLLLKYDSDFNPSAKDKMPYSRLIDGKILATVNKTQAVKTVDTLQKLLGNIIDPPDPTLSTKYRHIKLSNKVVKRDVVDVAGAEDFLALCGLKHTSTNFEPYMVYPSSPTQRQLHALRVGYFVLLSYVGKVQSAEDTRKRMRELEQAAEQSRIQNALLAFEEDRQIKKERDEREKRKRDHLRDLKLQEEREKVADYHASKEHESLAPASLTHSGEAYHDDEEYSPSGSESD